MKFSENGSNNFENPNPGTYAGICYKVIDVGTQAGEYLGKPRLMRKVIIGFEINKKMADGRPFVVSEWFSQSLSEKANLRKQLESWKGRELTTEELKGFDAHDLLGSPCMLSLVKKDSGKIKIGNISMLAEGMTAPTLTNTCVYFSLDPKEFDQKVFDGLSDGIKSFIVDSPEYKSLMNGGEPKENVPAADDIPF